MRTIIKSKKDVKELLEEIKKASKNLINEEKYFGYRKHTFSAGGSYWKQGYGDYIYIGYSSEFKSFIYNYKQGNSELLNDIEITEEEAINEIWENRKYINYFTREEEAENGNILMIC